MAVNPVRDRFAQHPVHATLEAVLKTVGEANLALSDPIAIAAMERFRKVAEYAKGCLAAVDPDLCSLQALDAVLSAVSPMQGSFQSFLSGQDWNQLNNSADLLLNSLNLLPRFDVPDGVRLYSDQLHRYQTATETAIARSKAQVDEVAGRSNETAQKLASFDQRLAQYDQQIEAQKTRVDALIAQQQTQFNDLENGRQAKFADAQSEMRKQADSTIASAHAAVAELLRDQETAATATGRELSSKAQAVVADLDSQRDRAAKIVGIIGNTGITGHYQRIADREYRSANFWRWAAVGFSALAVLSVMWIVAHVGTDGFSWQIAIFRLAVGLACSAPAIYCARESGRHRRNELRNRRIELELASISAYLERLPAEKSQKIIEELAPQYFGNGDHEQDDADSLVKLKHLRVEDFLQVAERVSKIAKP